MPTSTHRKRLSLGTTFILVVVLVLSSAMGISIYINSTKQHLIFKNQIRITGEALVKFTALICSDAIISHDFLLLNQYMKEISQQENVAYGVIYAADGKNLTAYLNRNKPMVQQYQAEDFSQTINNINSDPNILVLRHDVEAGETIGTVVLGINTQRAATHAREATINQVVQGIIIILILSFMIYLIFRLRTLKPIKQLIHSTRHVMNGNLEHKASIPNSNELAELAESFNKMTQGLAASNAEKDEAMNLLTQANEDLQTATKAKSAFLANMSHEIRTPLTAIIGFGETLLEKKSTPSEQYDATQSIIRNGKHLQSIINDILDLSKIEAEKLEIECIEVSMFDLLNDIESLINIQALDKGIRTAINFCFPIPKTIHTDPVRLKQILINLCNNAIKFTAKGSVHLKVSYDNVNQVMQFDVVDTGIGLTLEHQKKIFQPFTQADSTTTRQYGGTGLGLPLSRKLAEMLGGQLSVSSQLGFGSRFTVTIATGFIESSQLVQEIPSICNTVSKPEPPDAAQTSGHILLVEDTVDNQKLISLYIRRIGAQVTIAENGRQAVDTALKNHFDLILMDMQMPVMDGIEAVNILREKNYTNPIVALTANAMKEDRNRCLSAGCNDFLTKPVDRNKFNEVVSHYLDYAPSKT